jgi:hypothetical protein
MSEKPEAEEFDEDDVDEIVGASEDVDLDRVTKDLDLARKRDKAVGDPAWRRLERLKEEKYFAELVSDFEDYDVGDGATMKAKSPATR